jgi:poly-gamma-glutamate capsule biosynthesis protein CapA/YwtB (metallophosphatase superfamily)
VEIYKGKPIFYGLSNFVFQQQGYDPAVTTQASRRRR